MKLRNPLMIRAVSVLLSWTLRGWLGTLTYRSHFDDPSCDPRKMRGRGIFLFWHEMLILPTVFARHGFSILTSQHADGELIAQVLHMLGGRAVRGSTTKSGLTALRGLIRTGNLR